MIQLYYGFGKGKTTAAIGAGMRAFGAGMSVLLIQFLKDCNSSEISAVPFEIFKAPEKLPFNPEKKAYQPWVESALDYAAESNCQIIILDELLDIIQTEEETNRIINILKNKPDTEFIITGHKRLDALFEIADYITCFTKEKHPYDKGVKARKGIEY